MSKKWLIFGLLFMPTVNSFGGQFYYTVRMANYGQYGVKILEFPRKKLPTKMFPGIPGVRDDFFTNYDFNGDRYHLPDNPITIVWQLNELTDCELVRGPYESRNKSYPGKYTRKMGCKWKPIPGKIYLRTIDIKKLAKESETSKHIGEKEGGFLSLTGKKVMLISLIFIDDRLDVHIGTYVGNPWAKLHNPRNIAVALLMD